MENCFQLFCLLERKRDSFPININKDQRVYDSKMAIKAVLTDSNVPAYKLELYQVDIEPVNEGELKSNFEAINNNWGHAPPLLYAPYKLSKYFGENPPKADKINILIRISRRESRDLRPCRS